MREENSWDANLSLKVPLPNIGRRESFKRSQLNLDKILTDQLQREREIIREVKQAYRSVKSSESSLIILKRTVEQSRKSLEQELGRFDVGLSTSNDVRKAQDDLFEAQTRYFNELLNYQINIARLYKALGIDLY
jgi:outer membrane protein